MGENMFFFIFLKPTVSCFFLKLIPQISSLAWYTTVIPLIVVLSITGVKDAIDDVVKWLPGLPSLHLVIGLGARKTSQNYLVPRSAHQRDVSHICSLIYHRHHIASTGLRLVVSAWPEMGSAGLFLLHHFRSFSRLPPSLLRNPAPAP